MMDSIRISKDIYHLFLEIYPRVVYENFTHTQATTDFEQMAMGAHSVNSRTYSERNYYLSDSKGELKLIISRPSSGIYVIDFINMRDKFLEDMWRTIILESSSHRQFCTTDNYYNLKEYIKGNFKTGESCAS